MRRFIIALAVLLFGCVLEPVPSQLARTEASEVLGAKTVALVREDPLDGLTPFCTGVWVDQYKVVTASHCVHEIPIGGTLSYATKYDIFVPRSFVERAKPILRIAYLVDRDREHDLALLLAQDAPAHGVAELPISDPLPGQFAQQVGQAMGLWWTYSSGDVSAIRRVDTGFGGMFFVQTTTPTSPGYSGGGLFNSRHELIGIAHACMVRGQNLNLFIHPTHMRSFLAAH